MDSAHLQSSSFCKWSVHLLLLKRRSTVTRKIEVVQAGHVCKRSIVKVVFCRRLWGFCSPSPTSKNSDVWYAFRWRLHAAIPTAFKESKLNSKIPLCYPEKLNVTGGWLDYRSNISEWNLHLDNEPELPFYFAFLIRIKRKPSGIITTQLYHHFVRKKVQELIRSVVV